MVWQILLEVVLAFVGLMAAVSLWQLIKRNRFLYRTMADEMLLVKLISSEVLSNAPPGVAAYTEATSLGPVVELVPFPVTEFRAANHFE